MARKLRMTLILTTLTLLASAPLISAAPGDRSIYLPIVVSPPPPLQTLTLQLSDLPAGSSLVYEQEVTNADAAQAATDPVAAAAAFVQQGRETSWEVQYSSGTYPVNLTGVGNTVYRYLTANGAAQGAAYTLAEQERRSPGYQAIDPSELCCGMVGIWWEFSDDIHPSSRIYYIVVPAGRYVTDVTFSTYDLTLNTAPARSYAMLALNHLPAVP